MTPSQASIDGTLTAAERAAPFALGEADGEPLPWKTRLGLLWDGAACAEVDALAAAGNRQPAAAGAQR